jgi:hypothetical protein
MTLVGHLQPEAGDPAAHAPPGLTAAEQEKVDADLARKGTVPGFVGRVKPRGSGGAGDSDTSDGGPLTKTCLCSNGKTVYAQQSCDDACGTHASAGSNAVDRRGCHYRGELMDCRESARRKAAEALRRSR